MARPSEQYPTDMSSRVAVIADRSRPDPDRPRLSEEMERRLEPTERASAACYAEAEELAYQIRRAAEDLAAEPPPAVANGRR
jgi:hypothetical protein